jgi:RNA-directed DNA polymerase
MKSVARRIVDRDVLHLIKMWLTAPVEEVQEDGRRRWSGGAGTRSGTPQGGVISPLLANIYMNRFLKYWKQSGRDVQFRAKVVAYADDFVILSCGYATEAMEWTHKVMAKLGLTLNATKTRVCDARQDRFDFLGYTFGPHCYRPKGSWYLTASPSKRSVARLKVKLYHVLRPHEMGAWPEVRDGLNRMLRGWANYFSRGTRTHAYAAVDHYVAERVRHFLRRRHKVSSRGTPCFSPEAVFGCFGVLSLRRLQRGLVS